jgi:hypothetical protein
LRDLKVLGGASDRNERTPQPERSTEELRASVARKLAAIIARREAGGT